MATLSTTDQITYGQICGAMQEAVSALLAGDLQTALLKATAAQGLFSLLPGGGRGFGGGNANMTWQPAAVDAFVSRLTKQANAAVGIQTTLQQPVRPEEIGSGEFAYGSQGGW